MMKAPPPADAATLEGLAEFPIPWLEGPQFSGRKPWFLKHIVHHREDFKDCALVLEGDGGQQRFFLFLFARADKHNAFFVEMTPVEVEGPNSEVVGHGWDCMEKEHWEWNFKLDISRFLSCGELPVLPFQRVSVLLNMHLIESYYTVSPDHY